MEDGGTVPLPSSVCHPLSSFLHAKRVEIDFGARERDALFFQKLTLFGEPAREAGEGAVGADDTVTGDGRGVGVFVERVADGAVALAGEPAGHLGVGDE